jgi:hypothetical protein
MYIAPRATARVALPSVHVRIRPRPARQHHVAQKGRARCQRSNALAVLNPNQNEPTNRPCVQEGNGRCASRFHRRLFAGRPRQTAAARRQRRGEKEEGSMFVSGRKAAQGMPFQNEATQARRWEDKLQFVPPTRPPPLCPSPRMRGSGGAGSRRRGRQ